MSEESEQATDGLTPQEASERADAGAQLVDVRSEHEWEAGHIGGATHIVYDELSERAQEIDRDRPVILYCRGGNRSSAGAAAPAPERPQAPAWQRAALLEGVSAKETIEHLRGGSAWLS